MLYSKEEKQKIYDAIDQIKAYITTLQPQIRDKITIDFGPIETYANYERESAYHLYVYPDDISGRSGGLGISFAKKKILLQAQLHMCGLTILWRLLRIGHILRKLY